MTEVALTPLQKEWNTVYARLEKELGNRLALRLMKRIIPDCVQDNQVKLLVPTPCIHDLIKEKYADQILTLWQEENPSVTDVTFQLGTGKKTAKKQEEVNTKTPVIPEEIIKEAPVAETSHDTQNLLDATHTFSSFVVGPSNEFAFTAAKRVAEDETPVFNPLYIQAPVGLGKTHLMHAMAWRMKELFPNKKVVYMSCEQFLQQFVQAMRNNNADGFHDLFRSVDVLMVDDIQFLLGKERTQEEFFHTFNTLIARGKKIILSSDSNPMDLKGMEERLKTRIVQGLVVDIKPTSYELRLGILQEKVKNLSLQVPDDVLSFLATHITASVRELEGALKRIVARAELIGTPINLETTQEVLKDILHIYEKKITIEDIQQKTADYYHLSVADLKSARRDRKIARPRQLAMYLSKTLTTLSLPDIGIRFDRDHTTIIHAIKTVENLLPRDKEFMKDKEEISKRLKEFSYVK